MLNSIKRWIVPYATLIIVSLAGKAHADTLSLGVGKLVNNVNTSLPGYVVAVHGNYSLTPNWGIDASYMKLGKTQMADDAAITTAGATRKLGRLTLGLSAIVRATYNPAVWWNDDKPGYQCQIGEDECRDHRKNDGIHLSKSCQFCGGVVSASLPVWKGLGVKLEYYGLRKISPTFQGAVMQVTYTIGSSK